MPSHDFKAIATFAKAGELGSIRQAALAQGVWPQAASQTIAQLEQHLEVRLLHCTTRSLALTEEGQRFPGEQAARSGGTRPCSCLGTGSKEEVTGPLRIVGPKLSFAGIVMPLLDESCQEHLGIQSDIQLDNGIGNWGLDRVDVGFRIPARRPSEGGRFGTQHFLLPAEGSAGWGQICQLEGPHTCPL